MEKLEFVFNFIKNIVWGACHPRTFGNNYRRFDFYLPGSLGNACGNFLDCKRNNCLDSCL